jgi:hypothetical protein
MLDHVFSFLKEMRDMGIVPNPPYRSVPKWICRLMHTPYASVKELDLKFLKAAVHCDGYLVLIKSNFLDYGRLRSRPSRQACINLLYETVSLINGCDQPWYTHRPDSDPVLDEYQKELQANLEFNRVLFPEEASHLGPLHCVLPDVLPGNPGFSLEDKRYMNAAESNEFRKKLRYTLKKLDGVIPDVSHARYVALSAKFEDQKTFDSLIRPVFDRLIEERELFALSGFPVGKPPDGFDSVIRKGVPNAFAGKFYAVELLTKYRRLLRSLTPGVSTPEFVPPADFHGRGPSAFILTHIRSESPSPANVLVNVLRRDAVSPPLVADILRALGASDVTIQAQCPGSSAGRQSGPLALLFTIARSNPSYSWADCEKAFFKTMVPTNLVSTPAVKKLAWDEFQLARERAVELFSEAELLRGLRGSPVLEVLR